MHCIAILLSVLLPILVHAEKFGAVRGIVARRGQFPYHATIAVVNETDNRFSGALLSAQVVVTSATPFDRLAPETQLVVSFGVSVYAEKDSDRVDVFVKYPDNIFIHEEFDSRTPLYHNLAIVRLSIPVDFTAKILPVALPSESDYNNDFLGASVLISGWGQRYATAPSHLSKALNYIETEVFPTNICIKQFQAWESHICTETSFEGYYCVGGWGAPVITNATGSPTLIAVGIEPSSCSSGTPLIHTRIAHYMYWIEMRLD